MNRRKITRARRAISSTALAAIFAVAGASQVWAQSGQSDPRWKPWLGCWQPVPQASPDGDILGMRSRAPQTNAANLLVCVVPAAGSSGVVLTTIEEGKVVARESLEATAGKRPTTRDGCSGWESAQWSDDNRRIYVRSDASCPGGLKRNSSGLLAMSPNGEWLDIQSVSVGDGNGVRVSRYVDAGIPRAVPADMAAALEGRSYSVGAARIGAGAAIGPAEVIEASRIADAGVVQAWLVERGQGFVIDANRLLALADAGVPGSITDVMVALSNPKVFDISPSGSEAELRANQGAALGYGSNAYGSGRRSIFLDPFGYSSYGYSPYGYSRYGYSPYGYSAYGYSPYGYGLGSGYYWNRSPVIVGLKSASQPHGRAVFGSGYTRGGGSSAGTLSAPRTTRSSGSGASSSRGTSSSGSGRTAKPRR